MVCVCACACLGPLKASLLVPARIALSVPLINVYTHPLVAGPILASHPLDLQEFPALPDDEFSTVAHVGPASVNTEVKLVGVEDDKIQSGANPVGKLFVRGPPVGKVLDAEEEAQTAEGWTATGDIAQVYTNGAFKVLQK